MLHPRENDNLFGHEETEQQFIKALKNNKLHHAWILTGEQGIGKATYAYHAAKYLLSSPKPTSQFKEGWDAQTVAKVNALSHPDLFVLESDHEGKSDIKIDLVRDLSQFCNMTPVLSKYKVVIIDSINDLNVNSANALLKQLEEPHPSTIFLLVCHSIGALLPTIRSRCRLAKFKTLSESDFYNILNTQDTAYENDLYDICHGSLNLAKHLTIEENFHVYNDVYELLLGKVEGYEKNKLIHKLADDKLWALTCNLIELNLYRIAKEQKSTIANKFKLLEKAKQLLYSANKFHLDKIQTLTIIFQNSYA